MLEMVHFHRLGSKSLFFSTYHKKLCTTSLTDRHWNLISSWYIAHEYRCRKWRVWFPRVTSKLSHNGLTVSSSNFPTKWCWNKKKCIDQVSHIYSGHLSLQAETVKWVWEVDQHYVWFQGNLAHIWVCSIIETAQRGSHTSRWSFVVNLRGSYVSRWSIFTVICY